MSGFWVTPEVLAAGATHIDARAADIQTKLHELKHYVMGLENFWKGSAQRAFQTLMMDYDTYSRMLHDALVDIASGMRGNQVSYSDAEQANLSNIVRVNLPPARF